MTINDYFQLFLSRLWLLILGTVLAGVACYFAAIQFTNWPPYEARAVILLEDESIVSPSPNTNVLSMLHSTIGALAVRPPLTQQVVDQLDLGINEEELKQLFRIEAPETTPLVEIVATHKDPQIAADIANAIAQGLVAIPLEYTDSSVLAAAKVPDSPLFTSFLLPIVGALLGLSVAIGGVLFSEKLNNIVRHERDIRQHLSSPFLGTVKYKKARNGRLEASLDSLEWVLAKVYIERGTMPDQLLVTSPRSSRHQSDFVYMFIHSKLGHNLQPQLTDNPQSSDSTQLVLQRRDPQLDQDEGIGKNMMYEIDVVEWSINQTNTHNRGKFKQAQIIDGTPVLSEANTVLMAGQMKHVLLVLDAKQTKISDTLEAEQLLTGAGAEIIGSVLLS